MRVTSAPDHGSHMEKGRMRQYGKAVAEGTLRCYVAHTESRL
jgi:hypothetical protein